ATGGLVMTVTAGRVMVGDNDVGTQHANLQHHASQYFLLIPGAKRLVSRLRKTKIAEAEEVWLRALHFGGGHRLASANHTEIFIELGTHRVLSALTESREKRDGVNSVFATEDRERAAVFVIRMRGDTHHSPGAR